LQITNQLKISGPSDLVDSIEILNPGDENRMGILRMEIESGNVLKLVVLKSDSVRPNLN
jgi:predicted small integral membrane protein